MDKSNIKNKDTSLKNFCNTLKSRQKTVFKLFMERVNKPLLSMITDEDFQSVELAIDMRTDLSFASKNSYKSILNNLKEKIHKYTSQNVDSTTNITISWKDLEQCDFRQKNSKGIIVCRNRKAPIRTTELTPETCQLCKRRQKSAKSKAKNDKIILEHADENYFDCTMLCKKQKTCNSVSRNMLDEIIEENCYVSKYPYEWRTREGKYVRLCEFMVFPRGFPHDAKNPYPQCIAKQKDARVQLPKDRIIKNPEICWICYKKRKEERKKAREKRELEQERRIVGKATRGEIVGGATRRKVDWGDSEGLGDSEGFTDYL